MKALYLLNTEKLDYNFKVLKEKDEENTILTNILKNKKRNYTNRLTRFRNDYKDVEINHNTVFLTLLRPIADSSKKTRV